MQFCLIGNYQAAMKLPQSDEVEKLARNCALQNGLIQAINVPLSLARHINDIWPYVVEMAHVGNVNCKSDLQVCEHFFFQSYFCNSTLIYVLMLKVNLLKGQANKHVLSF